MYWTYEVLQSHYDKTSGAHILKRQLLHPVFKKGDKQLPGNYRGITLLSVVSKLFTKLLAEYIVDTGISEEQQGFRCNRSTIDAIFIMCRITEKAIEFDIPAFLCFVDLTKVFAWVILADVIKVLE